MAIAFPVPRNHQIHCRFEDSDLAKALSCVPVFGWFISLPAVLSLSARLQKGVAQGEIPRTIKLIQTLNEYKAAAIVRNMFSIAIMVAGVALGCMSAAAQALPMVVCLVFMGINAYGRNENERLIERIHTEGIQPGMRVV